MYLFEEETLLDVIPSLQYTFENYPSIKESYDKKDFTIRPIASDDYHKGYFNLVSETTDTSIADSTEQKFQEYFHILEKKAGSYYVVVIEHTGVIIAACTLISEQKFIHETALRGRIESLHVLSKFANKGYDALLIETLTLFAKRVGCYKTTLNAKQDLVEFYKNFNYVEEAHQNYMVNTLRVDNNNDNGN